MKAQGINIFLVDDNRLMVTDLKHFLSNRFGTDLNISVFNDGESCIAKIDEDTHIVILDYFLDGKNGLEVLKLIKEINPKTEVIMLSSNEDIVLAIDTFRNGATDYVIKGDGALKKISKLVYHIITEPIRKYMAIFLLTFVSMGVVVLSVLYSFK
jgi:DNA-binding NarL/FixJ family response regulator